MKILMATMGMNIGGAETHILELSKELKHQGHDVIIVSNGGVYVPEIEAAGIRHYQAPMHRRGFREMRRSRTILRDIISRERPDVVHAHARIPAFLCGSLQKRMGFPFVTTAHWVFDTSGILRYLTNWGQRTVAVSVRGWPGTGEFPRELARLCDHLHQAHGLEMLFLLMQPDKDREATRQVRERMSTPSYVLDAPCTPRELMGVLGKAKLCLAMRLHTLIFAARMAVPSMGLVYDPKVDSYLRELDLPAAGNVDQFDGGEAIRRADQMLADYDGVLYRLKIRSGELAQEARENERLLLKLLEESKR